MNAEVRLFWSNIATGHYLETDQSVREHLDECFGLIGQLPLIGVRLKTRGIDHRRRFVCAGFRIVYGLKEAVPVELNQETSVPRGEEPAAPVEITIMRFKRA